MVREHDTGIALRFEHVDKSFRLFASPLHRLLEAFSPRGKSHHVPAPVLRDVSFDIPWGQTVAVIGANGVGKSTLLHLAASLLQPSSGTVTVNGRVTGLLDLGGSFLPDLTGRENARFFHQIITRGQGDNRERERAIEEFADIGPFFDQPVHTYSSGMFLRLAFASATCENPDILLIDEVLAVGDARFQQKCYRRIRELREHGTTILLVTHVVQGLAGLATACWCSSMDNWSSTASPVQASTAITSSSSWRPNSPLATTPVASSVTARAARRS